MKCISLLITGCSFNKYSKLLLPKICFCLEPSPKWQKKKNTVLAPNHLHNKITRLQKLMSGG